MTTVAEFRADLFDRLEDLADRVGKLEVSIAVLQTQVGALSPRTNPGNSITFRWAMERIVVPIVTSALTAFIIVKWLGL